MCSLVNRFTISEEHAISVSTVALKMEAISSSEILVPIYQTTWHHIPQQHHNPLFLNLSSQAMSFWVKSFFLNCPQLPLLKRSYFYFFTINFPWTMIYFYLIKNTCATCHMLSNTLEATTHHVWTRAITWTFNTVRTSDLSPYISTWVRLK